MELVTKARATLKQIEALIEPKHLFILPDWADPQVLDSLIKQGYLSFLHEQRDEKGMIYLLMGLHITESGQKLLHPVLTWHRFLVVAAMLGASLAVMNLIVLYWG